MSRRGFTLVELLVVIGVVAVLIGLLLPALSGAQRSARTLVCLSQLRQVGLAALKYAQDHGGQLPRSSHSSLARGVAPWGYALMPYLGRGPYTGPGAAWDGLFNGLYRCPEDGRRAPWSYGLNVWFELTSPETGEVEGVPQGPVFLKLTAIPRPASTVMFGELGSGSMADHIMAHFWYFGGATEVDTRRHGRRSNYLFVDGHGETLDYRDTYNPPHLDRWHPGRAK